LPLVSESFSGLFELLTKSVFKEHMSKDEEYRGRAAECRHMAEKAISSHDKQAWLKLADSWLRMLPKEPSSQHWPKASDEDSKESH
jgi:hypothetical protein